MPMPSAAMPQPRSCLLYTSASHKEADGFRFDPDTTLGIIYGELAAPFESERVQLSLIHI